MLPETLRVINLLKICLRVLGISHRKVARRLEMSPSYISKLFSGFSEMRLDHVMRICEAVGLDPAEFFALAYPTTDKQRSAAATQLWAMLGRLPAEPPKGQDLEAERLVEGVLRTMLTKMLSQDNGG